MGTAITLDFNDYDKSKNKNQLINLVLYELYESKNCENSCTNYKIYGTDENGNLITDDKGQLFFLSNN